jgi:glycosyltransferase involved in cell wall biosynthesis
VHGEKLKEAMVNEYKRSTDDIHVLPRGVNSIYTRYGPITGKEDPYTIMYFGRIWGYKGIRYLIEAEPMISEKIPNLKIIIAGTGEDFDKYRKMMINKDRFIVYNEFIPDDKVKDLFNTACLIVLPYVDGSQSGIIPQAYAFKKPVVITNVGSLPENVDNGLTGYIIPPRDTRKLADAVIDLLLNHEKRKEMGDNCYRKINEELAWSNIAPKTIEVYKRALFLGPMK